MAYNIKLINQPMKDALSQKYLGRILFTKKAEVYGCCIKLLTDQAGLLRTWEDNFFSMGENVRSHGRLVVLDDPEVEPCLMYEPVSSSAFMFNAHYYGDVKSVALAIAGDILEDSHSIYSVHGAAVDVAGKGIALIAPSKSGKTTHSWGLLRHHEARLVTDDWFFVRLSDKRHLAFASEKNCYVEGDIGEIWPEFRPLVERAGLEAHERGVVNVRLIVGSTGVVPMTSLHHILLLKRDPEEAGGAREMGKREALDYLVANDFCNRHQLVRDDRKQRVRTKFFRDLLERAQVHMVNTTLPPEETQEAVRRAVGL